MRPGAARGRPRTLPPAPTCRPTTRHDSRSAGSSTRRARRRTRRAPGTPTRRSWRRRTAMVARARAHGRRPQRARVPVHAHRRHRLAVRGADESAARTIVVEAFDPADDDPGAPAARASRIAGAGTPFHLAYLDAQREQPDTPLFPKRPRVRRAAARAKAAPAALRREGRARRRRHRVRVRAHRVPDPRDGVQSTTPTSSSPTPRAARCPGVELKVVTLDGNVAGPGEEGEIRAKGPQLMPRLPRLVARRRGLRRRRLLPHRRPRHARRRRLRHDHRPAEGHHHPQGREHLGQGGRGPPLHAPEGRRRRGDRPARRRAGERACAIVVPAEDPEAPPTLQELFDFCSQARAS